MRPRSVGALGGAVVALLLVVACGSGTSEGLAGPSAVAAGGIATDGPILFDPAPVSKAPISGTRAPSVDPAAHPGSQRTFTITATARVGPVGFAGTTATTANSLAVDSPGDAASELSTPDSPQWKRGSYLETSMDMEAAISDYEATLGDRGYTTLRQAGVSAIGRNVRLSVLDDGTPVATIRFVAADGGVDVDVAWRGAAKDTDER